MAVLDAERALQPDWHCSPVPPWGARSARLLVVGLAPGRTGANRTGIPFTGDDSGEFLFAGLERFGFAEARPASAPGPRRFRLRDVRITNAVRCLPPGNRPLPAELRDCRPFLQRELGELLAGGRRRRPVAVLALGRVAHEAVLDALARPRRTFPFAHDAAHALASGALLVDSFHPSRYNTCTGRLTVPMFDAVLARLRAHLRS